MDLINMTALFILQYVGHRVGDFIFQTDSQAQLKTTSSFARHKHCLIYSLTVAAFTLFVVDWEIAFFILGITLIEHNFIDTRKPVIWIKTFLETKIARNNTFDIKNVPWFVIVEIDQTIHILRILAISILFSFTGEINQ